MDTKRRLESLESRVNHLELRVNRPPVEDIRSWVVTFYEGQTHCAEAVGVSANFIHQIMSGRRPATDKIINRMIEDGFYGVDAMKKGA